MNQNKSNRGRSAEEIASLMKEWETSGLSKKLFAESKNINYMTFIGWFSRGPGKKFTEKKFIPIQIPATNPGLFAELYLSNHRKVVLHQAVEAEFLQLLLKC
jgi:hypothetical protein